jgi:hypothetical protein
MPRSAADFACDHCSLAIEPEQRSTSGEKPIGGGPAPNVEQGLVAAQTNLLGNRPQELWRIRFPVARMESTVDAKRPILRSFAGVAREFQRL